MSVPRPQGRVEELGERDIGGVLGGQIFAQVPDAGAQRRVRAALDFHVREVSQGVSGPIAIDLSSPKIAPQGLEEFELDHFGRDQRFRLARQSGAERLTLLCGD